jgi:hypothetical protein
MLSGVARVRTDVSEERSAFIIRVTRISELGTTLEVPSNRRTLRRNTSSETSVLTRATRHIIPGDGIRHSHRRENLKCYIELTSWALWRRRNVSPVMYELGFYIPEDSILHSHRRDDLRPYRDICIIADKAW